jgi:PmbA protein
MSANPELLKIAQLACERARTRGANQAAAGVQLTRHVAVAVRDGKFEEIKASVSRGLTLRVYVDGRFGTHSTSDLAPGALGRFVDDAVAMTRFVQADPFRVLPDPALFAGRSTADLGLADPAHATLTLDQRKDRALAAYEAARRGAGDRLISAGSGWSDSRAEHVYVTTNGFADGEARTSFWLWATVSLDDRETKKRPSEWDQTGGRRLADLKPAAEVGTGAAERTRARLGADKLDTVTLPLIIENRAVSRLGGGLLTPLSGSLLQQRRSCFEGWEGKVVAAPLLTLTDDPLRGRGLGSRRFDGEGLTARARPVIEAGVLRTFFLDSYYGRKLGRAPTTGGSSNLVCSTGTASLDGLLQDAGKAILVTQFIGGNSNPTTGDFSHGLAGFLVEGGKRVRPISSMNLAGNHRTFWTRLQALGNDPYPYGAELVPSLRFAPTEVAGR